MNWKIGATAWSLPGAPLDAMKVAAELGLSCIQLDLGSSKDGYALSDPDYQQKFLEISRDSGVEIVSVVLNDLCGCGFVHGPEDPRTKTAYQTIETGIKTAAAMHVPTICMPSFFNNAVTDDVTYARTVEAVQYACGLGREYGVTVFTENVFPAEKLLQFFADVGDENLHLLFDSQNYHQMAGLDCVPVWEAAHTRVGGFLHVKDGNEKLSECPLGQGSSQFLRTLDAIVKTGFDGHFILENNYADPDAVRAEVTALREMLNAAKN